MAKGSSLTEGESAPRDTVSSREENSVQTGKTAADREPRRGKEKPMPVYKVQRRSDREKQEAARLQSRLRLAALLLSVVLLAVSVALLVRASRTRASVEGEQFHRPAAARIQAPK